MTDKRDNQREGSDEALVVRYQRGDRAALSVLVRRHSQALYSSAYYVAGSDVLANQLALETFRQVMEQAGSFHIEMHFRTWIFGFLHRQIVEQARNGNAQSTPSSGKTGNLEPSPANVSPRLGRSQLLNRRITEAVAALPLAPREAFVLKLVGQLTIPELATATDSEPDTVRDRLRVALDRIRAAIGDTEEYARALR
jgi:RNA polymerase sigma-70 factor (ECF subfamily)